MSNQFTEICQKYLNTLNKDIDNSRLEEVEDEISNLKEEREEYVTDYGEDDELVARVDDEISSLQAEKEELERASTQKEELREEVLEYAASNFVADPENLNETTLRALGEALVRDNSPKLLIEDWKIEPETELDDVRRASHVIRKLALAKLGRDNDLRDSWESFSEGTKRGPFIILANAKEPLSPSQIADRLDEDVDGGTVGTRLRNGIHHVDYTPYHRTDGSYTLSTVGRLMIQEYEDDLNELESPGEDTEPADKESEEAPDQQITLDSTPQENE